MKITLYKPNINQILKNPQKLSPNNKSMCFDSNSETLLVSSSKQNQQLVYEVQKEGILQLRKLKNQKFRVVFNIFPLNNHSPQAASVFSRCLFQQDIQSQQDHQTLPNQNQPKQPNLMGSVLTINQQTKQLSQNRTIITFNAYLHEDEPPNLVILGYLISSLVLYHNWNSEFSEESALTKLLNFIGWLLKKTDIDKLNEEIKFKTGYEKTPYFLCLIGKQGRSQQILTQGQALKQEKEDQNYHNYLNDFYRFESQKPHSRINQALQTLIDYFPQRSSLALQFQAKRSPIAFTPNSLKQIHQLGRQFQQKLLGRQLFSFEFTSTTVENLLFQICQCFNTHQDINLLQIYNKVILSKKSRIETEMVEAYLTLVKKGVFLGSQVDMEDPGSTRFEQGSGRSIMPVSDFEMAKLLGQMKKLTINEMEESALNCMNLSEYLSARTKVTERIQKYENKLTQINQQLGVRFLQECHSMLEISQEQITIDWQQPESSVFVVQLFTLLTKKLNSFSQECMGLFTEGDYNANQYNATFLNLAESYLSKLQGIFTSAVQEFHLIQRQSLLQIETLNFELKKSQAQKRAIEKEYQLQLLMEAELKTKLKEHILEESSFSSQSIILKKTESLAMTKKSESSTFNTSKDFYRMKKLIEQLEEEVKDKNNQIEELTQILEKFEPTLKAANSLTFYEKKNDKFNEETQKLITQANIKISKFYEILEEVKNTEKHYETAKKSLLKERQKIIDEKKQSLKEISALKDKNEQVKLENEKLNEVIQQEKKALEKFTKLKEALKLNICELQADKAETNCALAEAEGELQSYRKALSLVVEQYLKGKSQNLSKFYKFLEHPKLKELLKPLVKH